MARKRFITSDMSIDEKIAALAEENQTAALMWPWFTTAFDDWGRMGANPIEAKLSIFPAFSLASKDITEAIQLINKYGLAHYYEVDGKPYLAVNPSTWYKYQTYIKSERKEKQSSKFPAPVNPPWEEQKSAIVADNQQTSATIVPSPSPSPSNNNDDDRAHEEKHTFVKTYEQEFGRPISPTELERLQAYVSDGLSVELVCEAIKRTREQGKVNIKYTLSILNDWKHRGIINLTGVAIADEEFNAKKSRKGGQPNGREPTGDSDPLAYKKNSYYRNLPRGPGPGVQ